MPQCRDVQTNGNVHMQSCRDGAGVSVRVVDESSRVGGDWRSGEGEGDFKSLGAFVQLAGFPT
jgi:hypothetical protein